MLNKQLDRLIVEHLVRYVLLSRRTRIRLIVSKDEHNSGDSGLKEAKLFLLFIQHRL